MNPNAATAGRVASRVLIVDDNRDAAATTAMLLRLKGHEVDFVTDGRECLPRLVSFDPDVLLLDLQMPGISGYELAAAIRSQPDFTGLPIIALSGFADKAHVDRSIGFGINQHLAKPADLATLEDAIAFVTCHRG